MNGWAEWLDARPDDPERQITVEFQAPESEWDKVSKLIAYARRLGITQYATDSFIPEAARSEEPTCG